MKLTLNTSVVATLAAVFAVMAAEVPPADQARATKPATEFSNSYLLGPDDEISVWALNAEEISNKPVRIATDGSVSLPLVGRVQAAGLTVSEFESRLLEKLRGFIRSPQVSVSLVDPRSQPVSVLGAVNKPGVYQVRGRKTLIEMLSTAEGIRPDAGYSVTVSRDRTFGELPLANARTDSTGKFSVATVSLKSIMGAANSEDNILVKPHDTITVPRAEMVYVIGEVSKPGGFVLQERETLSVLQAVALAGGTAATASLKSARILRPEAGNSNRKEIAVNLQTILSGSGSDVQLMADDILFVPSSRSKRAAMRTLETAIQVGTGIVIWRR